MDLTQNKINILSQNLRRKRLRLELLDNDMRTLDTIEGLAISGSITADANSDIRRSGNITMCIPNYPDASTLINKLDGFTIEIGGKIWLDKYVKISIGIDDITSSTGDTVWYKLGVFLINQPVRSFSGTEYTLSFACIDLMAKLTGQRQGQLTGTTTVIAKGYTENDTYIRTKLYDALIGTITELGGFTKYKIYPIPDIYTNLPYDIKVDTGATVYDILKQLMDIISTWQMYFDLDGVFTVEPIPNGEDAIIYTIDENQYISDVMNIDFENVKNQIVIYGRVNTLSYYTENTSIIMDNVIYKPNSDGITSTLVLKYSKINTESLNISATTFGFYSLPYSNALPITNVEIWSENSPLIYSSSTANISLVKFENVKTSFGQTYDTKQVEINSIMPENVYFIRIYDATIENNTIDISKDIIFEFMGKQSVSYNLVNDNKESPFYINNLYKEENYYAEKVKTPSGETFGSAYDLYLNNEENLTQLNPGTIITFIPNAPNVYAEGKNFTGINIYTQNILNDGSKTASKILNNIPLVQNVWINKNRPYVVQNKLYNDYTIWELRYENDGINEWFVLTQRNPYVLTKVLSSGEYDNIYADQLAYERCLYELYLSSNLNDNISIGIIPNYLIDVNNRILYKPNHALPRIVKSSLSDDERNIQYDYMTKNITYPLSLDSTAQTIQAIHIYDSGNLVGY